MKLGGVFFFFFVSGTRGIEKKGSKKDAMHLSPKSTHPRASNAHYTEKHKFEKQLLMPSAKKVSFAAYYSGML